MSIENRKLEQWIRRMVLFARPEGPCVKLVLRHNGINKTQDVCSIPAKGPENELRSADELVADVWQNAWDDAEGQGGLQKYVVLAYFADDPLRHGTRFPFMIQATELEGGEGDDDGPSGSEPPTKQGMLAQQMRHNEAIMRTSTMATGDIIRTQTSIIRQLRERIESLEGHYLEQTKIYEEMVTETHSREMELIRVKSQEKRKDEAFEQLKALGPVIVNKILGKKLLAESSDPAVLQLKEFMATITPEQMQKLQGVLGPGQLISIYNMYEALRDGTKTNGEDKSKEPAGLLGGMASSEAAEKPKG